MKIWGLFFDDEKRRLLKALLRNGLINYKVFVAFEVWNYWRQLDEGTAMMRITWTAEKFGISEITVRRYINLMEQDFQFDDK